MDDIIITFLSHYDAIGFFTQHQNIYNEIKVLPVPRKISSSCGSCVYFQANINEIDFDLIDAFETIYKVCGNEYIKVIDNE